MSALNWYTLPDCHEDNSGYSVLWTENGFYTVRCDPVHGFSEDTPRVVVDFFPGQEGYGRGKTSGFYMPPVLPPRGRIRIGEFSGNDRYFNANDAVERDMLTRSGHWLAVREECDEMILMAEIEHDLDLALDVENAKRKTCDHKEWKVFAEDVPLREGQSEILECTECGELR